MMIMKKKFIPKILLFSVIIACFELLFQNHKILLVHFNLINLFDHLRYKGLKKILKSPRSNLIFEDDDTHNMFFNANSIFCESAVLCESRNSK